MTKIKNNKITMNKEQLQIILSKGEGQFVEFKERIDKNLSREIVAFANATGGKIFIGVSDNSSIKGIEIQNKLKSQIYDLARNCDPAIKIDLEIIDNILIITVQEGKNKPYSCSDGFYLRIGANCQKLRRDEIVKMAIQNTDASFDKTLNLNAKISDIDKKFLRTFVKKYIGNFPVNTNLLKSLNLSDDENLTNAGLLLFSEPSKFFLYTYTDCVLFKGKDRGIVIDRKTFNGNLFSQLDGVMSFLKRNLNLNYSFDEEKRIEKYEIPIRALEEAVVNALIHRDYTISGTNIFVYIYDDRVEIISPGSLMPGISPKNFGSISVRRNEIIADIFARTPYVEKIASGIKRIKELCENENIKIKFLFDSFVHLIFYKNIPSTNGTINDTINGTLNGTLNDRQQNIVNEILKNNEITQEELINIIGISLRTLKREIEKLKELGVLKREGSRKKGYWVIQSRK